MKYTITLLVACFLFVSIQAQDNTVSTYYLIRHSEKVISENPNPKLTKKGLERADHWAEIFENIQFDAVYSTDYIRTRNTAQPTAKSQNIELSLYHPTQIDYLKFKEETKGKTVLIVGHSNTIPIFTNSLIEKSKYKELNESVYGNLYIINICGSVKTDVLLNLE